eukprot:CAMPEP_0116147448 /NCGR_PEP_ID=MMETSP0329-20121206/17759_1 /TAXON_ID=697910 /ORGANISM="Pseudo-nitzschia arenysensis, Strain B593" /LENGTH=508 /DNA_ID=CAMNT_0003643375 /DNA_START=54 /DNA_END=1580 /DNA_ORIENTATION=+
MATRCPFTISLFIGTAALVIYHQRNKKKTKQDPPVFSLPPSEVVFVLGAPGTGKGTQCQLLQQNLGGNWIHLSAGDLLREARDSGTGELADLIRAKMQAGEIVPSSVTVGLLEEAMTKAFLSKGSRKFLIDGFPRSHENLDAWEAAMTAHKVSFVLNFECPEEVLVGRLLERAKDSGRSDDNIEVIRKRFKTHVASCLPIIERFQSNGTPLHTIDSARSVQQVYASVTKLFGPSDRLQAHRPEGSSEPAGLLESERKYLIGGNWKCNGTWDENLKRVEMFNKAGPIPENVEVALCVPFVNISMLLSGLRRDIAVGAQNCGSNSSNGAYTGETGSHQLAAMGCTWVIIGHSERRSGFGMTGEPEDLCAKKCKAAIDNGLKVMFAIGESKQERESGITMEICAKQLQPLAEVLPISDWDKVAIAYEPVWAIGTGLTATPEMAQETHAEIRAWIADNVSDAVAEAVRIQYGGSMKGANAKDLLAQPDIDGGLIGGASLKEDFFNVVRGIPK